MDKKMPGKATQDEASTTPRLEVVRGENAGETFEVKTNTSIGRERDNDLMLLDLKASRHHAQVYLDADTDQWMLDDSGSANGTFLNDMRITGPTLLRSGDRITVGETELALTIPGRPSQETAPVDAVEKSSTETVSPPPAPAPTPAPASPVSQIPARQSRPPRLAWIAGGFILLICIAAVVSIYIIISRIGASDSTAENVEPPASQGSGPGEGDGGPPTDAQPAQIPSELALVYEDDFSDSFGGWDDAFDTYTRKVYGNNRYQIEVNASNLVAWGLANRDVADFEIEVEARQEDGNVENSYGLLFRFQDRENFYRFDISGDGFYLLSKFVGGEWVTLVDWTESEFINRGNAGNILKVSAFGPNVSIWVNGQLLATVTDNSLTHGNYGFFAGTFSEPFTWVSYDNLKMWTPPGEAITLIPTATRPSGVAVGEVTIVSPLATPVSPIPTATATVEPAEVEEEATEDTPTAEPTSSPTPRPTATATPVPLPEYASRNQTLARGEEEVEGRIVFPIYDDERGVYDIYMADAADGDNFTLIQKEASQPALTNDGAEIAYRSWRSDKRGLFARAIEVDELDAWGFDLFFESARPQFSPIDSSLMFFSRTGGEAPATYRVIDGVGQVMRREGFPIQGKSPKWAPDGQQFVYSSCLGSICGIISSNIDGSVPSFHPMAQRLFLCPNGLGIGKSIGLIETGVIWWRSPPTAPVTACQRGHPMAPK
jgi:hypothetical protein